MKALLIVFLTLGSLNVLADENAFLTRFIANITKDGMDENYKKTLLGEYHDLDCPIKKARFEEKYSFLFEQTSSKSKSDDHLNGARGM